MKVLIPFLFILVMPQLSKAESLVWKVEKNSFVTYLGGTIHILRPSDYPLPEEFERAYKESMLLTFEADSDKLKSPNVAFHILKMLNYNDERTLESEVSAETYRQLQDYAESFGLSLSFMKKAKPAMLMSAFMVFELKKIGINHEGIDQFFLRRGLQDKKQIEFLETPEEQINFLADMGLGNEDVFYQNMLRDLRQTQEVFAEMIKYWRNGENEKLDSLVNQPMKEESAKIYQSLLVDRNNNWLPKVKNYLKTPETEFVLVGAAHLIGEEGIVNQLRKQGFKVTKL